MNDDTLRLLSWAEYDFVAIDAELERLRDKLRRAGGGSAACSVAAKRLRLVRSLLRRTLYRLDADVNAARASRTSAS